MELKIVHADPKYSAVKLIEPTTLGYIHIAAEVGPRRMPFLPNGREKSALITGLKELAHRLEQLDAVERLYQGAGRSSARSPIRYRRAH
jgi:hypothetical protein